MISACPFGGDRFSFLFSFNSHTEGVPSVQKQTGRPLLVETTSARHEARPADVGCRGGRVWTNSWGDGFLTLFKVTLVAFGKASAVVNQKLSDFVRLFSVWLEVWMGWERCQPSQVVALGVVEQSGTWSEGLLWLDEFLHHFETTENHCWLVFTGESSFQGFLDGAKWILSIHSMLRISIRGSWEW